MTILPKKKQNQKNQNSTNENQANEHHHNVHHVVNEHHVEVRHHPNERYQHTYKHQVPNSQGPGVPVPSHSIVPTWSSVMVRNDPSVMVDSTKRPSPDSGHLGSLGMNKRRHHRRDHVSREMNGLNLRQASTVKSNKSQQQQQISPSQSPRSNSDTGAGLDQLSPGSSRPVVEDVNPLRGEEEDFSGYNSGDEYHRKTNGENEIDWDEKECVFERMIRKKGYIIKKMQDDGACMFRAIADQVYGDQEMHSMVRKLCMDYMEKNGDYYSQYVTENFKDYIKRKRCDHIHGNHVEMQALSELFGRPIQIYHYSVEPTKIESLRNLNEENEPIRLSYHRNVHYNSIVDPYKSSINHLTSLPAFKPTSADKVFVEKALRISEQQQLEQAMLEDKIRATDWEATNEAIEEQIARESYLEWLRENERRSRNKATPSSTLDAHSSSNFGETNTNEMNKIFDTNTLMGCSSPLPSSVMMNTTTTSPKHSPSRSSPSSSPTTRQLNHSSSPKRAYSPKNTSRNLKNKENNEDDRVPFQVYGDWAYDNDAILAQVLAQSQMEYIENLKQKHEQEQQKREPSTASTSTSFPSPSEIDQNNPQQEEYYCSQPSTSKDF